MEELGRSRSELEQRVALIHRVIIPDDEYPKEYAVLVTSQRLIFIRQNKTRSSFVLRGEMKYGTALVTDVTPKTLQDYDQTPLESFEADNRNITVPHAAITDLVLRRGEAKVPFWNFPVWLTMKRQGHVFRVYDFDLNYLDYVGHEKSTRFYMVPLGAFFKPRRMVQSRETILHDYAMDTLRIFQTVLPSNVVHSLAVDEVRANNSEVLGRKEGFQISRNERQTPQSRFS